MTNAMYQSTRVTIADMRVAIAFTKTVNILYTGTNGVTEWREIEPHEVRQTKDGNHVVIAMCRARNGRRTFRLDRISHYNPGTRGFILPWPMEADPDEITDWWTITSRTGHEIVQVELNTDGQRNPHGLVLGLAMRESGRVRAVCKAEGGVSIRRLRRRDVKVYN